MGKKKKLEKDLRKRYIIEIEKLKNMYSFKEE